MNYVKYFTKEIQEDINSMGDNEMNELLLGLEETRYWIAILRYAQQRMSIVQGSLATIDPIKNPTELCRNQGILAGQSDLQAMVISLKAKSTTDEEKKEKS